MKRSKLFQLLQLLSDAELKRFYRFLRSPFFNYTPSIVKFYELIRRYHPSYDSPRLHPPRLWERLFPGQPFQELKYWQLSAKLAALVKKYLVLLELEQDKDQTNHLYIKALGRRNSYDLFEKETLETVKSLQKQVYRDEQFFYQQASLLSDYFFHPLTPKHHLQDQILQQIVDSQDQAFVLATLRLGIELKGREKILNTSYQLPFIEEALGYAGDSKTQAVAALQLYQNLYQLIVKGADDQAFFKIKQTLSTQIGSLRKVDQSILLGKLINYAIARINQGDQDFYYQAFELYKISLEVGLIIDNDRIDEASFGNISYAACIVGETEWAKDFVLNHAIYLDEHVREDCKDYGLASVAYYKGDFREAIGLLTQHGFSTFDQMKVRLLTCQAAYDASLQEEEYEDFLYAQIEAFSKFLYREELHFNQRKQAGLKYLRFLRSLLKLRTGSLGEENYQAIAAEIQSETYLFGKSWLLTKLNDLKLSSK